MSHEIRVHMHEIQFVETGPHKGPAPCRAIFYGPDREANARKFAHVDELVEALQQAETWFREYVVKHRAKGDHATAQRDVKRADVLRAALAKIRGGQ